MDVTSTVSLVSTAVSDLTGVIYGGLSVILPVFALIFGVFLAIKYVKRFIK